MSSKIITRSPPVRFVVHSGYDKHSTTHKRPRVSVVIAIGWDLVEHSPKHWNPRKDKKIVCIDSVPAEIDDPEFWAEFRRRCRAINPEAYLVGEIWHVAPEWVGGDRFDALMNYPLAKAIIGFVGW